MVIAYIVAVIGSALMISAIFGAIIGIIYNDEFWEVDEYVRDWEGSGDPEEGRSDKHDSGDL